MNAYFEDGKQSGSVCEQAVSTEGTLGMGNPGASVRGANIDYDEYMRITTERRKEAGQPGSKDPLSMDFPAFNTDPAQLIQECQGNVYGYARVSTDHQDYARQIEALTKIGVPEKNIFKDKKSGKDFEREEYRKLMEVLQPGDMIVIAALDRFGRNMMEIKEQWLWITQYRQTSIVVIDQPILNMKFETHGLGSFISELVLAVLSLMAELERSFINKRMGDGLRRAKLEGKKLGRKRKNIPEKFWNAKDIFLSGQISQNMAARLCSVDSRTFKAWMERTGEIMCNEIWEAMADEVERLEKEERIRRAKIEYGVMELDEEEDGAEMTEEASVSCLTP